MKYALIENNGSMFLSKDFVLVHPFINQAYKGQSWNEDIKLLDTKEEAIKTQIEAFNTYRKAGLRIIEFLN
jgi:hypothetical protein